MTIGILGGTGPQGRGLTRRLAAAGHPMAILDARGIYAGRLRNAGQVEALTANLIASTAVTRRTPAC